MEKNTGWKRIVYLMCAIQVGAGIAMIGVMAFLPLFLGEIGVTDAGEAAFWAGLISGVTPFMIALSAPFWSIQADRRGPKLVMSIVLAAVTLTAFLCVVSTSPWQVFIFRLLQGLVGGFVDATGGGGWGPVVTTTLLTGGRTAPRTVVGSVGTSEFLVTVAASTGFLTGLGTAGISLGIVLALLAGGLVAAPIAAWLVSRLPGAVLGTAVGGLILTTNLRVLLSWAETSARTGVMVYGALGVIWAAFLTLAIRKARASAKDIREETDQALEEVRSTHQRGHAPKVAVPDDPITAGGPVRPVSVEPARSRTHADLVVEPV